MAGSITGDIGPDDIQVLSSERIVIEDSVEDTVARPNQKPVQSRFLHRIHAIATLGIMAPSPKKADQTT